MVRVDFSKVLALSLLDLTGALFSIVTASALDNLENFLLFCYRAKKKILKKRNPF